MNQSQPPEQQAPPSGNFSTLIKRSAALGGPAAAAGGTFADVITPIASAAPLILAITSLILLLVFTYLWQFKHKPKLAKASVNGDITSDEFNEQCEQSFSAKAFSLFAIATPMFFLFLILPQDEDKGVVATYIPGIAGLQESLFNIEKGVEELKEGNKAIKDDTVKILENVSDINRGIETLGDLGGLVANPETPEDFYHNARIHELGGDYGNARQAYLKYFSFGLDKLDPYLTFADMLKIQEGFRGAKSTFEALAQRHNNLSSKLALALLMDGDAKRSKLIALSEAQPDYGPVYYYVAEQFSEKTLGAQGSEDKKQEFIALSRFLNLDESGKVMRYYVDQSSYREVLQNAKEKHKALSMINFDELKSPIRAEVFINSFSTFPYSPIIRFSTLEKVKKIMYRWDDNMDYLNTGLGKMNEMGWREAKKEVNFTWKEMPWRSFKISIRFIDALDREQGPFTIEVDPIETTEHFLEVEGVSHYYTPERWWPGEISLMTIMRLSSYLFKEMHYSFGSKKLDQVYAFPDPEKAWKAIVSGNWDAYTRGLDNSNHPNKVKATNEGSAAFYCQLVLINGKKMEPITIDP
jgi:hypothetical protein